MACTVAEGDGLAVDDEAVAVSTSVHGVTTPDGLANFTVRRDQFIRWPENTVSAPLPPMKPEDIIAAFTYLRALQADDIDTACAVTDVIGPELHRHDNSS
ncbi:hypothetical protein [Streptomyces sp. NPDC002644]